MDIGIEGIDDIFDAFRETPEDIEILSIGKAPDFQ